MATIRAFTTIKQSRKLAEILSLETADMNYWCGTQIRIGGHRTMDKELDVPCWSLAALLSVLPNNEHITTTLSRGGWKIEPVEYIDKWFCEYEDEVDEDTSCKNFSVSADNPIDACVAMIEKLHELKML